MLSGGTAGWIAVGAIVVAAGAAVFAALAWSRLRDVRQGQSVLMGGAKGDLVEFAVGLQGRIDDVHSAVQEVAGALARLDRRIDGALSQISIVRYDAYEGTGGHQSASVALLDASRNGIIFSAIQGRDYARIYMKELDRGRSSIALSPEEQEAVERAMSA